MFKDPFDNRQTRIDRREERNLFRRRLMPVAWFIGVLGSLGLLAAFGFFWLHEEWPHEIAGIFGMMASLPAILLVLSFLRGHHRSKLDEP